MPANAKTGILFLAANPSNETRLRLGAEASQIKEALETSSERDRFVFHEEHAVRLDNLQRLLIKLRPDVVHFSGHGARSGHLVFEDASGRGQEVNPEALATLFGILQPRTRLVVLNACYSKSQGAAIAAHVDAVIGMTTDIADQTAMAFSKSLYESLGEGYDTRVAFQLARNYVHLQGLSGHDIPELLIRASANP